MVSHEIDDFNDDAAVEHRCEQQTFVTQERFYKQGRERKTGMVNKVHKHQGHSDESHGDRKDQCFHKTGKYEICL